MPNDESEKHADILDDTEEDGIKVNPPWKPNQSLLIIPSIVLSSYTYRLKRPEGTSKQLHRTRHTLCPEPSFNRLLNLQILH